MNPRSSISAGELCPICSAVLGRLRGTSPSKGPPIASSGACQAIRGLRGKAVKRKQEGCALMHTHTHTQTHRPHIYRTDADTHAHARTHARTHTPARTHATMTHTCTPASPYTCMGPPATHPLPHRLSLMCTYTCRGADATTHMRGQTQAGGQAGMRKQPQKNRNFDILRYS
jgi:hypothetical protein